MLLIVGRIGCFFTLLFYPVSIETFLIDKIAIGEILFNSHADSGSATSITSIVARHIWSIVALSIIPLADQPQESTVVERTITLLPALSDLPQPVTQFGFLTYYRLCKGRYF